MSDLDNGIIEKSGVLKEVEEMLSKREILDKHSYEIWQASDGRWKTHLPPDRKLLARSSLDSLHQGIVKYYKEEIKDSLKKKTIREIYPAWLKYKDLGSKSTTYASRLDCDWNKYYEEDAIVDIPVESFTFIQLEEWALGLIDAYQLTKKQYYNITTILRGVIDYYYDNRQEKNLFRLVKIKKGRFFKPEKKLSETQIFFLDEEKRMLHLAEQDYYKSGYTACLAICLNFYLGLRIGELMALKESDRIGNYLYVQRQEIRVEKLVGEKWVKCGHTIDDYLKSDKEVLELYLVPEARRYWDMITEHNRKNGWSGNFLIIHKGRHVHYQVINKRLRRYCGELGIINKSNHKIRKSVLSTILDEIGLDEAMKQGGHTQKSTLLNNYHFSRRTDVEKERAMEVALDLQKSVTVSNRSYHDKEKEKPCKIRASRSKI